MLEWIWKCDSQPVLALRLCLFTEPEAVINMRRVPRQQTQ